MQHFHLLKISSGLISDILRGVTLVSIVAICVSIRFHTGEEASPKRSNLMINSVAHLYSDQAILFDALTDTKGRIRVVWQSIEEGVNYQYSNGKEWSRSIPIKPSISDLMRHKPRIFEVGDTLGIVFWDEGLFVVHSFNQGETWSTPIPTPFSPERVPLGRYAIQIKNKALYAVGLGPSGIFFSSSIDLGKTWAPIVYLSDQGQRYPLYNPSITLLHPDIHVIWPDHDQLLWSNSSDEGHSWSPPLPLINDEHQPRNPLQHPLITSDSTIIWALYLSQGIHPLWKQQNQTDWTSYKPLTQGSVFQFSACASTRGLAIATADAIHKEKDWWHIIPGALLVANPSWANSDLYLLSITNDHTKTRQQRLTPHLSLVSAESQPQLLCKEDKGSVFWSGRRKVGKTEDAFQAPVELFYILDMPLGFN